MNIKQYFKVHTFFYVLTLFVIISIGMSFYRFIIKNDYFVSYEVVCDPYAQSCFESCEDGKCAYYAKIQKYAPNVYSQCGKDITDCKLASVCLPGDRKCSITYCNEGIDTDCETFTETLPLDIPNIIEKPI